MLLRDLHRWNRARTKCLYLPQGRLCAGLAAAARIDHSEKHRSPTRNTPQLRAFRGTDAKEFPVLSRGRDCRGADAGDLAARRLQLRLSRSALPAAAETIAALGETICHAPTA